MKHTDTVFEKKNNKYGIQKYGKTKALDNSIGTK